MQLFIHILILLWMSKMSRGDSSSWAKANCQSVCGSISVPYPFGIGVNCSFDKWYEVECRELDQIEGSSRHKILRPYIKSINLELTSSKFVNENGYYSDADLNMIQLYVPRKLKLDLEGTPFFFSSAKNVFVGIGCNIVAYLTDQNENSIAWCASVCGSDSYPRVCEVSLQENLQTIRPKVQTIQTNITMNQTSIFTDTNNSLCPLTLLVDKSFYDASVRASKKNDCERVAGLEYVPVVVGFMPDISIMKYKSTSRSCDFGSPIVNVNNVTISSRSVQCSCKSGYYGNPYLPYGCLSFDQGKKRDWTATLIGVFSTVGALFLLIGGWCSYNVVKKVIQKKRKEKFFKQNGGLLLQQHMSSSDGNVDKTKVFNSYELDKATDHYNSNRVLGQGGQGTVYKGMLSDGRIVAVKKSKIDGILNVEQFINEVAILSQINQRNVVKLLGCCLETEVPLLVYEFISNGTLFQHIQNPNEDFPLTWEIRLRIATEIAGALSYLHFAASMPIFHRDIKSTNILLDDKYKARVCDFGTSRSIDIDKTHLTTKVQGTFGYLDPEFFLTSRFTDKSDVYSFGVVLVELLTGYKPIFTRENQEIKGLSTYFLEEMEQNRFFEMIDPRISNEDKMEEIVAVAHLAKKCLNMYGRGRPTMKEVAGQLEGIRMTQEPITAQGNYVVTTTSEFDVGEAYEGYSTSTDTWCESNPTSFV